MAADKRARRNKSITAPRVRVIGTDGQQIGIMATREAIEVASDRALDLVEVSPNADPPVCRVMDFGKYLFEQSKKSQSAKKKQKQIQIKEVKFRPGTDQGDYNVKLRRLTHFLEAGDKTKVTLRFRGREMLHQELGKQLLDRVESDLDELGYVEQRPKLEGRQMIMILAPRKK